MSITTVSKFLFLFLFFISCDNFKFENNLQIDIKEKQRWSSDSTGCLKCRSEYIEKNMRVVKSFIGKDYKEFVNNFGTANSIKSKDSGVIYVYWIGCGSLPKIKGISQHTDIQANQLNTETKYLKVEVDRKDIIVNVGLIIP